MARDQPLQFRVWAPGSALRRGPLGILEPSPEAGEIIPDILLVPLAAFDRAGHRIGYGAGHYDRTLARLRAARKITAIGLAFAAQEIADACRLYRTTSRLDLVLTENEAIEFPELMNCAFFSSATWSARPAAPPFQNICPA